MAITTSARSFLIQSKRVLQVTRKPDRNEFSTTVKVTGIGILVIGFVGFIIEIVRWLVFA